MKSESRSFYVEPSSLRDEIYQSNLFLQSRKDFDLLGMRLFLIAVSGINPHFSKNDKYYDKEFKHTFISTAKLTELLGSSKYLAMIPKACVKLALASVKLRNDNDSDSKLLNLFKHVEYISREGFYFCFNDSLRPHLLDLLYAKKGYTRVNVNYLLKLTSLYAVRLLEVLLQFQNIPYYKRIMEIERKLTVEQIRFMLNVPEGAYKSRMDNFRRHVLDLPIKEINDRTPYFLRYKPIKKGTKVVGFKFILSTHNVPFKVAGKKPQFSNDAINYLRNLGFKDESARAIYNSCDGLEDCLLRVRRAETLFYSQKENIRNRLGFLRRAIEQDWHSGSMPEKEDPRSKPGWSATIDFRSRRPGVPLRGPNKPVDKPPNYLPSDKMDKKLSNAIAQGEFYTPAEDNHQSRQVTAADKKSAQSLAKNDLRANDQATVMPPISTKRETVQSEPAPPKNEQALKVTSQPSASESVQSEPVSSEIELGTDIPQPNGESYYNEGYAKLVKLKTQKYATPEEYQKAIEQDFEEEMRELAEKKAREREEFRRKAREQEEAMKKAREQEGSEKDRPSIEEFVGSVITETNKKADGMTPLGDVMKFFMQYISPERVAAIREKRLAEKKAAENGTAQSEPEPTKKIETSTPQQSTTETAPPPKPKLPKSEPQKDAKKERNPDPPPPYLYILSPSEKTIATGGSDMYQRYKEAYAKLEVMAYNKTVDYYDGIRFINEKRALEKELLAKGEILPYTPPPMPKRTINIPLPPPPPPDYKKNARGLSKEEKIIRKGIEELIELYTEANRLNEEPESILKRTNDSNVKIIDIKYDTNEAKDFFHTATDVKIPLLGVIRQLELREVLEKWWDMTVYFVTIFEETPVTVMRRYIKTFGYLPPPRELDPDDVAEFKKLQRNVYTGEYLSGSSGNKNS